MVKVCQTGLLIINFEIIKKHIFRFLPKISAGHAWSWKFFFCQFPNPWTLRVSGMGCYTSKCEKKSKSLHPSVQFNILYEAYTFFAVVSLGPPSPPGSYGRQSQYHIHMLQYTERRKDMRDVGGGDETKAKKGGPLLILLTPRLDCTVQMLPATFFVFVSTLKCHVSDFSSSRAI